MTTHPSSAFKTSGVRCEDVTYQGRDAILVTMPSASYQNPATDKLTDRALLAWLQGDFGDGTIEVSVASALAPDAPDFARGFIGVAFRIDDKLNFEGIYLRPANSRVDDQIRRNHSTQYFSYPDYDFSRLRRESPEKYESYVDIGLEEWIDLRIVVRGDTARLFVNGGAQPSLVISDLKHGREQSGGVGLWIESGTMGYFSGLRVSNGIASA
jgi:hypothetical protein